MSGKKILKAPLRISVALLLLGMMARIMEWPFAAQVVIAGFFAIGILYSIRFWNKQPKLFIDYVKLVLIVFWTANGLFRMMNFEYTLVFQIITGAAFVTWFIMEGTAYFMDDDRRAKNSTLQIWWNIAMVMGTLSIIGGSLMTILQWEYATPLLVMGIIVVALYILKDLFSTSEVKEKDTANEEFQI
ncbi:hypothetical protein FGM00_08215 [Aggregatimonas sangjinii]|uniref:Uncharacterized protein n=1 Tax=Aggregatimonas sangjinii TaxID=2583587 RepID=A0A5B7SSU7_9FLAO|nr:hypothetical protein [Aggregatimonas sangjinii]QCX00088.1 hypothetical protein FGM00_08215 [Aggregatimonas sangjinii]